MAVEISELEREPARPYMPTKGARDDHGSPSAIVDVVTRIFGGVIDLDPCGNPHSVVRARRQVWLEEWCNACRATGRPIPSDVIEGDGLVVPWNGNTYINPPFAAKPLAAFMHRAARFAREGAASSIALVPLKTEQAGWQVAGRDAAAICFLEGRLKFLLPEGEEDGAPGPNALVLWTLERELAHRFAWYLDGKLGFVVWPR